MSAERLICSVVLDATHPPTGNTKHFRDGAETPSPSELRIVQYEGAPGYYLLYLNAAGQELTDTWHESVVKAKEQARWEFCVEPCHWTITDES